MNTQHTQTYGTQRCSKRQAKCLHKKKKHEMLLEMLLIQIILDIQKEDERRICMKLLYQLDIEI